MHVLLPRFLIMQLMHKKAVDAGTAQELACADEEVSELAAVPSPALVNELKTRIEKYKSKAPRWVRAQSILSPTFGSSWGSVHMNEVCVIAPGSYLHFLFWPFVLFLEPEKYMQHRQEYIDNAKAAKEAMEARQEAKRVARQSKDMVGHTVIQR